MARLRVEIGGGFRDFSFNDSWPDWHLARPVGNQEPLIIYRTQIVEEKAPMLKARSGGMFQLTYYNSLLRSAQGPQYACLAI